MPKKNKVKRSRALKATKMNEVLKSRKNILQRINIEVQSSTTSVLLSKPEVQVNKDSCLQCPRDGCGRYFHDQEALDWHLYRLHKEDVYIKCDWESCGKRFKSAEAAEGHKKRVHYSRAPHQCTKCEKGFNTFESIKTHFLQTHTKWKKDESSAENGQINNSIDKESTSSESKVQTNNSIDKQSTSSELKDLRSFDFSENEDDSETDDFDFDSWFDKPKSTSCKVEITFECDWNNCGKCFKTSGDLEKHKKTDHVDNNKELQKCTKCDARFESFELVKTHFLHTHTNWKKDVDTNEEENAIDEGKDSEDVVIVKEYASNVCKNIPSVPKAADQKAILKEKINKNYSKIVQDRGTTDRLLRRVSKSESETKDTKLNAKLSGTNNSVDQKNTYVVYSEKVFYIVHTKPNAANSTSNAQDSMLYQMLSKNGVTNVPTNITEGNTSSITEQHMSNAKLAMTNAKNLMPDLRNSKNLMPDLRNSKNLMPDLRNSKNLMPDLRNSKNLMPDLRNSKNLMPDLRNSNSNTMPEIGNASSMLANIIPVVATFTPNATNVIPIPRNIIPDGSNVKNITSNPGISKPEVNKVTDMLANITPVIKNLVPNIPAVNIAPNIGNSTINLDNTKVANHGFSHISKCLDCNKNKVDGKRLHSDICGNTFMRKSGLDQQRYNALNPFICPMNCGERFCHPDLANQHTRVHTKQKYFHCHVCLKGFIGADYLKEHSKIHENNGVEIRANPDKDNIEIVDERVKLDKLFLESINEIESRNNVFNDSNEVTNAASPEGDTIAITDEDDSEVEDDNTNPASELSDEDDSSEEENITNDNTAVPSLFEDEVCLVLGENFDNTPTDPLSGINSSEDTPLPQTIKMEETIEPIPERLINIEEDNMEFTPVQRINIEETIEPVPHETVNVQSMEFVPLDRINTKETIPVLHQIVNIGEESMESMHLEEIKREDDIEAIDDVEAELLIDTDECVEPIPAQIADIEEDRMEFMSLEGINRDEDRETILYEQMTNTEECIELVPAKRIKIEDDHINLVSGQRMNIADANLAQQILSENRILQVQLERLPFFI